MSSHLSSEDFSTLYELLFSQQDAPKVKFQNPNAWREPDHSEYDTDCACLHYVLTSKVSQLRCVIHRRYGIIECPAEHI